MVLWGSGIILIHTAIAQVSNLKAVEQIQTDYPSNDIIPFSLLHSIILMSDPVIKDDKEPPQKIAITEAQAITSEFTEAYRETMKVQFIDPLKTLQLFKMHGIDYNPDLQFRQFTYQIIDNVLNFEFLKVKIYYAFFSLTVNILNDNRQSPFDNMAPDNEGKYGLLYFSSLQDKQIAVKSFDFVEQDFSGIFERTLLEWTILKLCSVLKCAPNLENYLGFDIIVYSNCIQFAMEKCLKITNFTQVWYQCLKEELQIMHGHNIVHTDIKHQNILFSPDLNKPVFIDFGFSSIIKEKIGFKKRTQFKGSPGYCSAEMLNLLSSQCHEYFIDLYFNDLYGLNATFKQELQTEENVVEDTVSLPPSQQQAINKIFFVYRFKFYYLTNDLGSVKHLLSDKIFSKSQIPEVLTFIRKFFHTIFHPEVIEWLRGHRQLQEYKMIERLSHLQKAKIRVYIEHYSEDSQQDQMSYLKRLKQLLLNSNGQQAHNQGICIQAFSQFLSKSVLPPFNEQRKLDMMLCCLSFNRQNISFQEKLKIVANWKINHLGLGQQDLKGSIEDICDVYQYLFQHCLGGTFTQWKKNNVFEIMYHLMLFGKDICEHFCQFMAHKHRNYVSLTDKLILKVDLVDLKDRLCSLDLTSNINHLPILFLPTLQSELAKMDTDFDSIKIENLNDQDTTNWCLFKDISDFRTNHPKTNTNQQLIMPIKSVSNKKLQSFFLRVIAERKVISEIQNNLQLSSIASIRSIMSKQGFANMDIQFFFNLSEIYMLKLELADEFIKIADFIKTIIGCESVYSRFPLEKYIFLVDSKSFSSELIVQFLTQISTSYQLLAKAKLPIYNQLYYLLIKIKDIKVLSHDFSNLLKDIHHQFHTFSAEQPYSMANNPADFEEIMLKLDVEKIFVRLMPECLESFRKRIESLRLKIEQTQIQLKGESFSFPCSQSRLRQMKHYIRLKYEYFFAEYFYNIQSKNQLGQLHFLLKIAEFSHTMALQFLFDYATYQIIKISNSLLDQAVFSHYILVNYKRAVTSRSAVNYLLKSKELLLIYTLKYFHKIGAKENLISLLRLINEWIYENPLPSYILAFLKSIQHFYLYCPQFFDYNQVKQILGQSHNPYLILYYIFSASLSQDDSTKLYILKALAKMLYGITNFAKAQILQKYYRIILKIKVLANRKITLYFLRYQKGIIKEKIIHQLFTKKLGVRFNLFCQKSSMLRQKMSKVI